MTYGAQIFNNSGQVILDTAHASSMQVKTTSTLAHNSTLVKATGDLVCWNRGTTGYLQISYANSTSTFTNLSGVTVNYAVYTITGASTPPTSPDYGFETYNSSGTKTYSMGYTKGIDLIAYHDTQTLWQAGTNSVIYTGNPTGIYVYTGTSGYSGNLAAFLTDSAYFKYESTAYIGWVSYINPGIGGIAYFKNGSPVQAYQPRN